jgi:hypothetical protein
VKLSPVHTYLLGEAMMVRQEQDMGEERTSTDSGKAGAVDVQMMMLLVLGM